MADASDSKSDGFTLVRVQVPPSASVRRPETIEKSRVSGFLLKKLMITLFDYTLKDAARSQKNKQFQDMLGSDFY